MSGAGASSAGPGNAAAAGDGLEVLEVRRHGTALRARIRVAPASAWFRGHFPTEPILPAVAQLGLAHRVLLLDPQHPSGGGRRIAGVERLRLLQPVRPGAVVELLLEPPQGGERTVRYILRKVEDLEAGGREPRPPGASGSEANGSDAKNGPASGGEVNDGKVDDGQRLLSDGVLRWESGDEAARPFRPRPFADAAAPADDLLAALPHTPPARLVEEVLEVGDEEILARGRVPAEHASAVSGPAPTEGPSRPAPHAVAGAWMALELAAQAAGLLAAAALRERGAAVEAPPVAYLVRLRGVAYTRTVLPVEAALLARVRKVGGSGPLSLYEAVVSAEREDGGPPEEIARGTLGTFLPRSAGPPGAG